MNCSISTYKNEHDGLELSLVCRVVSRLEGLSDRCQETRMSSEMHRRQTTTKRFLLFTLVASFTRLTAHLFFSFALVYTATSADLRRTRVVVCFAAQDPDQTAQHNLQSAHDKKVSATKKYP